MSLWLIADIIGAFLTVKVFEAWVRRNGWQFWEWHGVVTHLLHCPFCLGFWLALGPTIYIHSPLHAFGIGAAVFAFWQLVGDDKPEPKQVVYNLPQTLPIRRPDLPQRVTKSEPSTLPRTPGAGLPPRSLDRYAQIADDIAAEERLSNG